MQLLLFEQNPSFWTFCSCYYCLLQVLFANWKGYLFSLLWFSFHPLQTHSTPCFHVPIALMCIRLSVTPTLLTPVIYFQSVSQLSPQQPMPELTTTLQFDTHCSPDFGKHEIYLFYPLLCRMTWFLPFLKTLCTREGAVLRSPLWQREDRVLVW